MLLTCTTRVVLPRSEAAAAATRRAASEQLKAEIAAEQQVDTDTSMMPMRDNLNYCCVYLTTLGLQAAARAKAPPNTRKAAPEPERKLKNYAEEGVGRSTQPGFTVRSPSRVDLAVAAQQRRVASLPRACCGGLRAHT